MALNATSPSADGVRAGLTTVVGVVSTRTIIALRGEADVATTTVLSDVLLEVIASGTGDVVIDLAGVTFIDSAAIFTLAQGQRLLHEQGRALTFRSPSRLARVAFSVYRLDHLIEDA